MPRLRGVLPARIPVLRPEDASDLPLIVRWIQQAREDGVFRSGPVPTPSSLKRYRRSLMKEGWRYESRIIEASSGSPTGYIDWRRKGSRAELLGIYLVPRARRRGLARHVVRRLFAELREQGVRRVTTLVYETNEPSLHACRSGGMTQVEGPPTREEGKVVICFSKRLEPFPRLGPLFPSYASLRGENIFFDHVAAAEALAGEFSRIPGVEAVLGLGSVSRGFADQHSDLDLAVLGRSPAFDTLWRGEKWIGEFDVDLFGVDLDASPPEEWDDGRKQAFGEAVVLWSRDHHAVTRIRRAVSLGREGRRRRIRDTLLKLGWIGLAPPSWHGRRVHGYLWSLPPDLWEQRGNLESAHVTLDQGLDLFLGLLFLLNGHLPPDPKWRRFLARSLPWLPSRFGHRLRQVELSPRSEEGMRIRRVALLSLVDAASRHAREQGDVGGDIYVRYLAESSDYDPRA